MKVYVQRRIPELVKEPEAFLHILSFAASVNSPVAVTVLTEV